MTNECAFEPDIVEIHCVQCGRPTGETGTCRDVGFCAACRRKYVDALVARGVSLQAAKADFSAMLIGMIEGRHYKVKFVPQRVLHIASDGKPLCGAKGGPHPLTTNRDESSCKRCMKRGAKR